MLMRMIYDEALAQASYFIACQAAGQAIVIDPQRDVDQYMSVARALGLRIVAVAETHIHADFASGARELAHGAAAHVYVSGEGGAEWSSRWLARGASAGPAHTILKDNGEFCVGNIRFRALHTPGHTPEHMSYLITDGAVSSEPIALASGDFIFVGDVGRPDLLESAAGAAGAARAGAEALLGSVRRAAGLADHIQVWPGHGAGSACGKSLGAIPISTIGYEKLTNRAFQLAGDRDAFMEYVLADQPEPPVYFGRMKRLNRDGPALLAEARPGMFTAAFPPEMSATELAGLDAMATSIVDTRTWAEFKAGHIAGSFYVPLGASFPTDAGSLLPESAPIVLVCPRGRASEAVRGLVHVGLDRVVGFATPETLAGVLGTVGAGGGSGGVRIAKAEDISAADAAARLGRSDTFFLDVRRAGEFRDGHIPGATNASHTILASRLESLPRSTSPQAATVIVNCKAGGRSARACALLKRHGYNALNLEGGFTEYARQGLATQK